MKKELSFGTHKYRDIIGRYSAKPKANKLDSFAPLALLLVLLMGFTMYFGTPFIYAWIDTNQETYVKPPEKDNITKLTDNLNSRIKDMQNAKATLDRANTAQRDALTLYNQTVDNYNAAVDLISLYNQGI